jgi:hypothetical protein
LFDIDLDIARWPCPEKEALPRLSPTRQSAAYLIPTSQIHPGRLPEHPSIPPPISRHYWPPLPLVAPRAHAPRPAVPLSPPAHESTLQQDSEPASPLQTPELDHVRCVTPSFMPAQAPTSMPIFLMEHTKDGTRLRKVSTPAELAVFIKSMSIPR